MFVVLVIWWLQLFLVIAPKSITLPALGIWLGFLYQAWFLPCGVGLRSSQLVIGYSQDSTPVTSLSCHALCRGSQVSQLNRTIVCFLSLEACIAPSNIMKTSPQVGGIYSRSNLAPPGPVSKVCSVFSNRELAFHFWKSTKGKSNNL